MLSSEWESGIGWIPVSPHPYRIVYQNDFPKVFQQLSIRGRMLRTRASHTDFFLKTFVIILPSDYNVITQCPTAGSLSSFRSQLKCSPQSLFPCYQPLSPRLALFPYHSLTFSYVFVHSLLIWIPHEHQHSIRAVTFCSLLNLCRPRTVTGGQEHPVTLY